VLGNSGDLSLLEGPNPSEALLSFASEIRAGDSAVFEEALARMTDGLRRFIRADLVFENFWSAVLV
jgi:hypothetical protein